MTITFDKMITQDFGEASTREWLETNGLGGWASSTLIGVNTRRYHGLLVAATQPPVGRVVLLSKLDETIATSGQRFELGCNQFPGAVQPTGFKYLQRFEKKFFPVFEYRVAGIKIRKTIAALHGENTTLLLYDVLEAPGGFTLELRPFVAGRDFHSLSHANDAIEKEVVFDKGVFRVQPYPGVPQLFISVPGASFTSEADWYYNFEYPVERFRGLDYQEDLFTYGVFKCPVKSGDKLAVMVSAENPAGRDPFRLLDQEKQRRESLLRKLSHRDELSEALALAADQFIVRRGTDLHTIIAGYHWFADWGRDTMIALPGLCLVTGRFAEAKQILRAFAAHVSQGMLPNRFPDVGEEPEYNTVDATLWFFVAIYKYYLYTKDRAFVRDEMLPILQEIIRWYDRGTRYNIHVAEDGLLFSGEAGVQLTWMDAKVGDWVVTPRDGKAVEINALWYNALKILADLSKSFGRHSEAKALVQRAGRVKARFLELFWEEKNGYLYDVVNGEHKDMSIRPNQLFALSLPFPPLTGKKASRVLAVITEKLLTPYGLRSLAPDDSNYRPHYGGGQLERDGAYHQGTVWSWLLGPYISALVRFSGTAGRKKAMALIEDFKPHLLVGGVGTISEIFEARFPHDARGCIAQAWSVGELLRTSKEDLKSGSKA